MHRILSYLGFRKLLSKIVLIGKIRNSPDRVFISAIRTGEVSTALCATARAAEVGANLALAYATRGLELIEREG